ncbi:hypothetical protein HK101_010103 [Irineochytrium annulatum]|nr:hypothetical protein HK101_010103 [Irineochytrium annulatum]
MVVIPTVSSCAHPCLDSINEAEMQWAATITPPPQHDIKPAEHLIWKPLPPWTLDPNGPPIDSPSGLTSGQIDAIAVIGAVLVLAALVASCHLCVRCRARRDARKAREADERVIRASTVDGPRENAAELVAWYNGEKEQMRPMRGG